jgi:hypothetical protein
VDGTRTLLDYVTTLSIVGSETRVIDARLPQEAGGPSKHGGNTYATPLDQIREVGAAVNRGTQFLYVYGRAYAALKIISECQRRLFPQYSSISEALLLNAQLRINRVRLHRALGQSVKVQDELTNLQADASSALAHTISPERRQKVEAAVQHMEWLEPYKCAWRSGEFERCRSLAMAAPRPSDLADECVLRSSLELGEYDHVLRLVLRNPSPPLWSRTFAAVALCRGKAQADFQEIVENLSGSLSSVANLRLACEAACAGDTPSARRLASQSLSKATADNDASTQLLAASLIGLILPNWKYSSDAADMLRVFIDNRHNVTRLICLASQHEPFARQVGRELLTVVDAELINGFSAYSVLTEFSSSLKRIGHGACRGLDGVGASALADANRLEHICWRAVDSL